MITLREMLDSLSQEDRARLDYAFEHGLAQYVKLPNNRFIGVNTDTINHLQPVETKGKWSYGRDHSRPIQETS